MKFKLFSKWKYLIFCEFECEIRSSRILECETHIQISPYPAFKILSLSQIHSLNLIPNPNLIFSVTKKKNLQRQKKGEKNSKTIPSFPVDLTWPHPSSLSLPAAPENPTTIKHKSPSFLPLFLFLYLMHITETAQFTDQTSAGLLSTSSCTTARQPSPPGCRHSTAAPSTDHSPSLHHDLRRLKHPRHH